jgi:hypothetical protein
LAANQAGELAVDGEADLAGIFLRMHDDGRKEIADGGRRFPAAGVAVALQGEVEAVDRRIAAR